MRLVGGVAALLAFLPPLGAGPDAPPTPTAAEFNKQLSRLERKDDKFGRLAVLKWLNQHSGAKNAGLAVPALERCIRADPHMPVRREAVLALARIARERKQACPLAIIEAFLDKEDEVRWQASAVMALFKTFAPGTVPILLRCARSEKSGARTDSLFAIARAGPKDKSALAAIERAKRDRTFEVRHNAHCAMFKANDRLDDFLAYMIRVQQDPEGTLSPVPKDAKARKREEAMRNLVLLGSARQIIEWTEKRPDQLAPALLKFLGDKSPLMRRGAAQLIGAAIVKVDLSLPKKGHGVGERPEKSRVGVLLEQLNVAKRLRKLGDADPDRKVRQAARAALQRLAALSEKKP
jgi:HEAT repeat protein